MSLAGERRGAMVVGVGVWLRRHALHCPAEAIGCAADGAACSGGCCAIQLKRSQDQSYDVVVLGRRCRLIAVAPSARAPLCAASEHPYAIRSQSFFAAGSTRAGVV